MHRGTFNDMSEAESLTIAKGLEKYLEEITPKKKGSYQDTNRINKLIANTKVSSKTLATFKSYDCAKYRDEMTSRGLSASTINKELSVTAVELNRYGCSSDWIGRPFNCQVKASCIACKNVDFPHSLSPTKMFSFSLSSMLESCKQR